MFAGSTHKIFLSTVAMGLWNASSDCCATRPPISLFKSDGRSWKSSFGLSFKTLNLSSSSIYVVDDVHDLFSFTPCIFIDGSRSPPSPHLFLIYCYRVVFLPGFRSSSPMYFLVPTLLSLFGFTLRRLMVGVYQYCNTLCILEKKKGNVRGLEDYLTERDTLQ